MPRERLSGLHRVDVRSSKQKRTFPFLKELSLHPNGPRNIPRDQSKEVQPGTSEVQPGIDTTVFVSKNTAGEQTTQQPFGEQFGTNAYPGKPTATATIRTACPKQTTCIITHPDDNTPKRVTDDTTVQYDDTRRVDPPGI